ncbi:MAG: hypothetical protein OXL95_01380, partial [Nitrospira sp.]|nr:hypothetical protein [Nitrospira sp.]
MNIRNMKRTVCILVTITTMALAGCGGGGGGGGTTNSMGGSMPDSQQPSDATTFAELSTTAAMNARIAAAKVADARPRFGSITQSSNAINSITQDLITVTTEYGASQNTYSVQNGATWSISTANGNPQRIQTTADDTGGFKGSELNRQVNGGTLWVDVYSDIEAPT